MVNYGEVLTLIQEYSEKYRYPGLEKYEISTLYALFPENPLSILRPKLVGKKSIPP